MDLFSVTLTLAPLLPIVHGVKELGKDGRLVIAVATVAAELPAGLPPEAAAASRDSLDGALTAAQALPGEATDRRGASSPPSKRPESTPPRHPLTLYLGEPL
jgi:hypothetical protein